MYGPPQAPQVPQSPKSPLTGGRVALLVLFCALALLSCGFLAWAPMLRVAVLTRRPRDWALFGATFAVAAGLFTYAGVTGDQEATTAESFVAVGIMMVLVAGPVAYYLVTELRRLDRGGTPAGYRPPGYGHPSAVTVPSAIGNQIPNPYAGPAVPTPGVPVPQPQPQPPVSSGPRIDQVRAELDELSDLLRKDPGSKGSNGSNGSAGEGGR
ncbi:hypothetical protein PUR59_16445 [Streptomyces sp. SP18ES09]|uniref:hypothetical protein n=1 Tax=Streptomyces sp. SP18ES09 TaxID=3002532 RepID=UPI002E78983C|nr:hypothetical protein [Streptomyces sp. SP18ES09]MEE1816597.1 hypothetical protein [Streptomyces sp. SP18ES09]